MLLVTALTGDGISDLLEALDRRAAGRDAAALRPARLARAAAQLDAVMAERLRGRVREARHRGEIDALVHAIAGRETIRMRQPTGSWACSTARPQDGDPAARADAVPFGSMSIRAVLVCGAGLMGHGIAQVCAVSGHDGGLFEADRSRSEAGLARIRAKLHRAVAKGRMSDEERRAALSRIRIADALGSAVAQCDLVLEAVFEDEAVKRSLFSELDQRAPEHTILASNPSSISITRLAAAVRPGRRSKVHRDDVSARCPWCRSSNWSAVPRRPTRPRRSSASSR